MNKVIALVALLLTLVLVPLAQADVYVSGYTRSDGSYVGPHYRSSPNSSTYDNWSTKGNINPYTGKHGSTSSGDWL